MYKMHRASVGSPDIPMRRFNRMRYQPLAPDDLLKNDEPEEQEEDLDFGEFSPELEDVDEDQTMVTKKLLTESELFALGTPGEEKRFWFQRSRTVYDADALATQPSVFDDSETADEYRPGDD